MTPSILGLSIHTSIKNLLHKFISMDLGPTSTICSSRRSFCGKCYVPLMQNFF